MSSKSLGTVLRNVAVVDQKAKTFKTSKSWKTSQVSLPINFDGRTVWPGWLQKVHDQEECGNCYAYSTSSMLADRFAILSLGRVLFEASPSELAVCGHDFDANVAQEWKNNAYLQKSQTDFLKNRSCNGSSLYDVLETLYREGVTISSCFPSKTDKYNIPGTVDSTKLPVCSVFETDDFDQCPVNNQAMRKYRALTVYNVESNEQSIMYEIYKYGPVSTGLLVFPDFMTTFDGKSIYTGPPAGQESIGGHAILISGFGQETQNGQIIKYWLCKNSWGDQWGDGGYFKIQRNIAACQLEQNVVACLPDIPGLKIIDSRIVPVETIVDLQIREYTGHYLDPITGYFSSAIAKIKAGILNGDLTPIFDSTYVLPDMETFFAGNWQNTSPTTSQPRTAADSSSSSASNVDSLQVTSPIQTNVTNLQNVFIVIGVVVVVLIIILLTVIALKSKN